MDKFTVITFSILIVCSILAVYVVINDNQKVILTVNGTDIKEYSLGIIKERGMSYDPITKTVNITNAQGVKLGEIQLLTELDQKVIDRGEGIMQTVAILRVRPEFNVDKDRLFDRFDFEDRKKDNLSIARTVSFKREIVSNTYQEPIYEANCSGSVCYPYIKEYLAIQNKTLVNVPNTLNSGTNYIIHIQTDVRPGDKIEWYPYVFKDLGGIKINHWATWTDSFNVNLSRYWKFDNNGKEEIVSNNLSLTAAQFTGGSKIGQAYNYTGESRATTWNPSGARNWTINFWFQYNKSFGNYDYLLTNAPDNAAAGNGRIGFMQSPSDQMFIYANAPSGTPANGYVLSQAVGTWYMLTLRVNDTHVSVLKDGTKVAQWTATFTGNNQALYWFSNTAGGNTGVGKIDEAGFWERYLTDSEITDLYNSSSAMTYVPSAAGPTEALTVNLTLPLNNSQHNTSSINFNFSISPVAVNLTNYTMLIWHTNGSLYNQTSASLSGQANVSIQVPRTFNQANNYSWNVYACSVGASTNNLNCNWNYLGNRTFRFDLIIYNSTWNSPLIPYDIYNNAINTSLWSTVGTGYSSTFAEDITSINGTAINNGGTQSSDLYISAIALPNYTYLQNISFRTKLDISSTGSSPSVGSCGLASLSIFGIESKSIESTTPGGGNPCSQVTNDSIYLLRQNITQGTNKFDLYINDNFVSSITANQNNITTYALASAVSGATINSKVSIYNVTYAYGSESMRINLNTPGNSYLSYDPIVLFNINSSVEAGQLKNITLYVNSVANKTLNWTGQYNSTLFNITFPYGSYTWNALVCDSLDNCKYSQNRSMIIQLVAENSQTFTNPTYSGVLENYIINLTYNNTGFTGISLLLNYNNTNYTVTNRIGTGANLVFSRSLVVPSVTSQRNISFYWLMGLSNSSGTTYFTSTLNNQTVNPIGIDNCTTNTQLILNYTLRDEVEQNILSGNTSIELWIRIYNPSDSSNLINFNRSYNSTNPARVCITNGLLASNNFSMDTTARYYADSRVIEYNNLQNYSLRNDVVPININLLDLTAALSQEFLITVKDENYLPLNDALITIQRQYISEASFKTVESVVTDQNGRAIAHFDLNGAIYTIMVSKKGRVLYTLSSVQPYCDNAATGDCKISIQLSSNVAQPVDYSSRKGIGYNFSYTQSSRTVSFDFITIGGESALILLNVTRFDNRGSVLVCTNNLNAAAGTVSCIVPIAYANSTIVADAYKNGEFVANAYFTIGKISPQDLYGNTRIILIVFLYITLVFMAIGNKSVSLVMGLVGLVTAGLLNLVSLGTNGAIIGTGSAILWFIMGGAILLWKASSQ